MQVTVKKHSVEVVREEKTDKKVYSDSQLLYQVKQKLNSMGFDFIKKRMWKDGHLVDDSQLYLRERKHNGYPTMVWYPGYQINYAYEDFNNGCVCYSLEK
jgi:hypothetical protein